jgi:hypothetical protein
VIGGFSNLIAEQQADGPDARIMLVQFDSQDPHEVLIDARRITHAQPLTEPTFVPRGGTPLLDATGRRRGEAHDHADFYEGIKAAETDRDRRHGQ